MAPRPGISGTTPTWSTSGIHPTRTSARKGSGVSRSVFVYKDTEFWVLQNGRIECGNCKEYWCGEIQAALVANADGEDLWENLVESYEFEIPMIPTASQWAHIVLEPAQQFVSRVFEVLLLPPNMKDLTDPTFVGHIHPGEGRMVIRSMIFDWFRGNVETSKLTCTSSSHKMSAEQQWRLDMAVPEKAAAQQWSAWSTSMCLMCASGANNFEGLYPEMETKESVF